MLFGPVRFWLARGRIAQVGFSASIPASWLVLVHVLVHVLIHVDADLHQSVMMIASYGAMGHRHTPIDMMEASEDALGRD